LVTSLNYGGLQQSAGIQLNRPHAAGLNHTRVYVISATHEDTDAYERQGIAIFTSVEPAPRIHSARSYGVRLSADEYDNVGTGVSNAYVLSGWAAYRRDTTELTLDPRDGAITELRIEPSVSTGDATLGFIRGTAEGRIYESFGRGDRLTLAARARVGWLEAVAGDVNDVPPDRRFYAGGGGSVRGYEYNSIYPPERDLLGLAPGGQGLLETSVEARWRFDERFGAVAFVDGGTAFDDWSDAGNLSWGVGVGFRYNLGFAPLRVDLAVPLDDEESSEDYALYISIGQAF
jgi:translocation and assembly module TamA